MQPFCSKYLDKIEKRGIQLGLERVEKYLSLLGNPHLNYKSIIISGTNGKGSVASMVASILQEAGFKSGKYTSPHVVSYNERISVNGKNISNAELRSYITRMKKLDSKAKPTYFEFGTSLALEYFSDKKVDFAVLEVGMGGHLDATNICDAKISAITNVALEHEKHLGNTVLKIAREKAGIIKQNGIFLTTEKNPAVLELFRKICQERNAKFIQIKKPYTGKISLAGDYQKWNAALAEAIAKELSIPNSAIKKGLLKAENLGRFQIIRKNPAIIIDCAHNPAGMAAFLFSLRKKFPRKKFTFVVGFSEGKNYAEMLKLLSPLAQKFIISKAKYHGMKTSEIKKAIRVLDKKIEVHEIPNAKKAARLALKSASKKDYICICGSIYMIGDLLGLTRKPLN